MKDDWFDFLETDFIEWDDGLDRPNADCFYHRVKEHFILLPSFFFVGASYQDRNLQEIYKKFCDYTFLG